MRSVALACLALIVAAPAAADTFVLPHLLETTGSLTGDPGSLVTVIRGQLSGDADCDSGADGGFIVVWKMDADGTFTSGPGGTPVCAPCTFPLDAASPSVEFSLAEVIVAAGISSIAPGGGYLVVATEGKAAVSAFAETADTGELVGALRLHQPKPSTGSCRTFVFPHLLENTGVVPQGDPDFDTTIFASYVGGLQGGSGDPTLPTRLDLYLYDKDTGLPLEGADGTSICSPCSFPMGDDGSGIAEPYHHEIVLEELILAAGGAVQGGTVQGDLRIGAVARVLGNGDDVAIQAKTDKKKELNLGVFIFTPKEVGAVASVAVEDVARAAGLLRNSPNPFNPLTTLSFALPRAGNVVLKVTDVRGRTVRTLELGHLAAGEQSARWDGRDDSGRRLPSGTYMARVESGRFHAVRKVALLK